MRKPLQPPYDGPFKILHSHTKTFDVEIKNKKCAISIDQLKPTFLPVLLDSIPSIVTQAPPEKSRSAISQTAKTRTGRKVHFLKRYTA